MIALSILLLLSAFFSGAKTALFSANRLRLRQMQDEGSAQAGVALRLLKQPGRLLSNIQVGFSLASVAASVITTVLLIRLVGPQRGPLYAFALVALLLLTFGYITPR